MYAFDSIHMLRYLCDSSFFLEKVLEIFDQRICFNKLWTESFIKKKTESHINLCVSQDGFLLVENYSYLKRIIYIYTQTSVKK